jgi:hypothetical protein
MKRYYLIILTVAVFVITTGIGTVFAGGSSDTSGEGYHCYLFFTLPDGTFAQFMVNSSDILEIEIKVEDAENKYIDNEDGDLSFILCGNAATVCVATAADDVPPDTEPCAQDILGIMNKSRGYIIKQSRVD